MSGLFVHEDPVRVVVKTSQKEHLTAKIGFYEARTHLSKLLDEVARGKKVLITRRGKPAALLSPPPKEAQADVREVIRQRKEFRRQQGPTLGLGPTIHDLSEEGRRFRSPATEKETRWRKKEIRKKRPAIEGV